MGRLSSKSSWLSYSLRLVGSESASYASWIFLKCSSMASFSSSSVTPAEGGGRGGREGVRAVQMVLGRDGTVMSRQPGFEVVVQGGDRQASSSECNPAFATLAVCSLYGLASRM